MLLGVAQGPNRPGGDAEPVPLPGFDDLGHGELDAAGDLVAGLPHFEGAVLLSAVVVLVGALDDLQLGLAGRAHFHSNNKNINY